MATNPLLSDSITKLLADTDIALSKVRKTVKSAAKHNPTYSFMAFNILTPVGFQWSEVIVNVYNPVTDYGTTYGTLIVHGHEPGQYCNTPDFCHSEHYRPTGLEHPVFIKAFNTKWAHLYKPIPVLKPEVPKDFDVSF